MPEKCSLIPLINSAPGGVDAVLTAVRALRPGTDRPLPAVSAAADDIDGGVSGGGATVERLDGTLDLPHPLSAVAGPAYEWHLAPESSPERRTALAVTPTRLHIQTSPVGAPASPAVHRANARVKTVRSMAITATVCDAPAGRARDRSPRPPPPAPRPPDTGKYTGRKPDRRTRQLVVPLPPRTASRCRTLSRR